MRDVRALVELERLFHQWSPDVVHTHNPKPGLYGRVAARAARVPAIVNTVHGLYATPDDRWQKRAVVYSLERVAATCSNVELVQNPEDVETLARLGVPRRKLRYLGNGVDLVRFDPARVDARRAREVRAELGVGPDDVVCGAVGRLVWEKGYRELFEAARRLRVRVPNLRIAVIGPLETEKRDGLTSVDVESAEALGNVRFLGYRDDVDECYAAMDIHVLASHREGFPRSPMEAAAMGVPVIATNIRGSRQAVDPGTTGLLVPPRDARALADAIEDLARRPQVRAAMGAAARAKAQREFDQQRVIDITLETYERVLEARRNRWW
jgi:glycosyltransferase involved in cell wall biosynthesis